MKNALLFSLLVAALLIYIFLCNSNEDVICIVEPQSETANFRGNVKSVKQRCYRPIDKFGELLEGGLLDDLEYANSLTTFKEGGYYTFFEMYDTLGNTFKKEIVKTENNNCINEIIDYRNDTPSVIMKLSYDFENLILENKRFSNKNILLSVTKIRVNKKGKPIEIKTYSPQGKMQDRTTIEYNEEDEPILKVSYDETDMKTATETWRYDKREKTVENSAKTEKESLTGNYGMIKKII